MNFSKILVLSCSLLFIGLLSTACGGSTDSDKQGKEYTSAYICPMHCEGSGSDQAGKCPVCKMDYVQNEDYKGETGVNSSEESNSEDHSDHDHSDHDGHNH